MNDRPRPGDESETTGAADGPALVAEIVDDDAAGRECTIFPLTVPTDRRTTTWLTAGAGSFVALDAMR